MRRLLATIGLAAMLTSACGAAIGPTGAALSPSESPSPTTTGSASSLAPTSEPTVDPTPSNPIPDGFWAAAGRMLAAGPGQSATLLPNGEVFVNGGTGPSGLFDPLTGASMITGGSGNSPAGPAIQLKDGRVLIGDQLWDPRSAGLTSTGPMIDSRQNFLATILTDGRVLVAGGFGSEGVVYGTAELFDPKPGSWAATGTMTTTRGLGAMVRLADGRVLVAGGVRLGSIPQASAELYDPGAGTWAATGSMAVARQDETATLLVDGRVLVVGGSSDGTVALASGEVYDPATGRWTTVGEMSTPRDGHTATRLPDGRVLVAGGQGKPDALGNAAPLSSSEIFDPMTGTWTTTVPMTTARAGHAAALLQDGRVLVVGGFGPEGPLNSVEIYSLSTT